MRSLASLSAISPEQKQPGRRDEDGWKALGELYDIGQRHLGGAVLEQTPPRKGVEARDAVRLKAPHQASATAPSASSCLRRVRRYGG